MASHDPEEATTRRQRRILVALGALALVAGASGWLLIDHRRTAAIEGALRRDIAVVRPRIADAREARRQALAPEALASAKPGDAPCRSRRFAKGEGLVGPERILEIAEDALARRDVKQADLAHVAELKAAPFPDEIVVVGTAAYVYGYAEKAIVCAGRFDPGAAPGAIEASLRAVPR